MKIAIVILNWNGQKLLEKFLPSVIKNSNLKNVTIYVADNASTDNSIAFIEKNYPSVKIIKNQQNGGYAKGYNDALKHIEADVFALLNSDIEVEEKWLDAIITTFENEAKTAIIQPKILDFKNKNQFEYAGAAGGFIDELGYPYCRGRIFSVLEYDMQQFNDTIEIFWASGACFFIRSQVFFELGGFDEDYFAHQEEIDLCWRAKNLNHTIKNVGTSIVYHVGGATLKEESPRKSFLNFRNSLFSLTKNLPKNKIIPILFIRMILDGIAGIKFLLELRPIHTLAIIRAHVSFYYYLPKTLKKRNNTAKNNRYFKIRSIVWNYFILGKQHFKDL